MGLACPFEELVTLILLSAHLLMDRKRSGQKKCCQASTKQGFVQNLIGKDIAHMVPDASSFTVNRKSVQNIKAPLLR